MQQQSSNSTIRVNSDKIPFTFKGLKVHSKKGQQNLLALHQSNPKRYPFLLESVAQSTDAETSKEGCQSRFDILFAFPQETLMLSNQNKLSGYSDIKDNDFLDNLNHWWQSKRQKTIECQTLPFSGGWFLYLGYELANQVEPHLTLKLPTTPIAYATRIPAAIIYDHLTNSTYTLCEESFDFIELIKKEILKQLD